VNKFLVKVSKSFNRGEKGFTLIEILIVIAVLAALAAIVVPAVSNFLVRSKVAAANTELANMKTSAIAWIAGPPSTYTEGDDFDSEDLAGDYSGEGLSYMQGAIEYGYYEFNGNGELIGVEVNTGVNVSTSDSNYTGTLSLAEGPKFVADGDTDEIGDVWPAP
jgi:prepilin-type N-terminal cleavage/methylation domain-containing protein